MVDVKDAVGWAGRYSPICLICGCLLAIGHAYDHYVQFRRNDFLQGELSESQWEQVDQLHTLYMCSSVISLLLIFTTCKLSFRLQLPQLLVLGTVVVLSQIVLSTSTYLVRKHKGFDQRSRFLTANLVAHLGGLWVVAEAVNEQRIYQELTRKEFLKRLRLTDKLDQAMAELEEGSSPTAGSSKEEWTIERLDGFVRGGSIQSILQSTFSHDDVEAQRALQKMERFMGKARAVLPLTYTDRETSKSKDRQERQSEKREQQLERIAVARIGMEVAKAWAGRIAGVVSNASGGSSVFLGGSCNPTTWRKEITIPMLEQAGVPFYNPQVDEWSEELVAIEARAKERAAILLFVISAETRAMASVAEAAEYVVRGRSIVLVIQDVPVGATFGGERVSAAELKDLNRSRSYLRDISVRHAVACAHTVVEATELVVTRFRSQRQ